jgi:hypothetical protein
VRAANRPPDIPPDRRPGTPPRRTKYYVDDVEVRVATERVQYLDADGKLITESLKDYTRKAVRKAYASLDDFLTRWNDAERKQAIIENSPPGASSSTNWPSRSAATTTPSTSSATSPSTSRRSPAASGPTR